MSQHRVVAEQGHSLSRLLASRNVCTEDVVEGVEIEGVGYRHVPIDGKAPLLHLAFCPASIVRMQRRYRGRWIARRGDLPQTAMWTPDAQAILLGNGFGECGFARIVCDVRLNGTIQLFNPKILQVEPAPPGTDVNHNGRYEAFRHELALQK